MKKYLLLTIITFSSVIYFITEKSHAKTLVTPNPELKTENDNKQTISATVYDNSKFAFNLLERLETNNKNTFFSPYSISSALAMTYAGSKNETKSEISKTLYFNQKTIHSDFKTLTNIITKDNETVKIANSIFVQKDFLLLASYTDLLNLNYNTSAEKVDFKGTENREKARLKINNWVESKTNNKIKNLIKKGALESNTRLVLVNAIYFLSNWYTPFDTIRTKTETFHTQVKNVNSEFMNNSLKLKYFEDDIFQVVELPYKEKKYSMTIFLPKKSNSESNLITYDLYQKITNSSNFKNVNLSIPKFRIECDFNLKNTLMEMGMPKSFNDMEADFSAMTGLKDLYIGTVIHKAFIDVSEKGTEAAAATAVLMNGKSASPIPIEWKTFKADHPFTFIIKENESNSILFMGTIIDPNK